MIKIFVTIRNRLEITKKCMEALIRRTTTPHQIYVYDNLTDYRIKDHWDYFCKLYEEGKITQYTCNTQASTFNAFSKAIACNTFGQLHNMDPNWNKYEYLVLMDNDIFVMPKWDLVFKRAWDDVTRLKLTHFKVITQSPGGIKGRKPIQQKIAGLTAFAGFLGGSGFWTVRPNFFREVGFLDVPPLVGLNKKHDQSYWVKMKKITKTQPYILGLETISVLNCGGAISGSMCNILTRHKKASNLKEIVRKSNEEQDKKLMNMNFEEFHKMVWARRSGLRCW